MGIPPLPPNPIPVLEQVRELAKAGKATADIVQAAQTAMIVASPALMMGVLDPDFTIPRHVRLIDQHLVALHRGHFDRLMIVAPPRAGKSMMSSQAAPLWRLRQNPQQQGIVTHSGALSETFGGWARNQIYANKPLQLAVRKDSKSKSVWSLDKTNAGLWAVGIGAGINGRGYVNGHGDDLVASMEEALNPAALDKQWDWWWSEFLTRRTRTRGRVTLSACWTRWAEQDVGGRILATERDRWCVLHLKAISETDETLETVTDASADMLARWQDDTVEWDRPAGEPLWPEVYDLDYLNEYRTNRYIWSALFQGEPTPTSGGLFRAHDFQYFDTIQTPQGDYYQLTTTNPDGTASTEHHPTGTCRVIATADLAASTRTQADFTVISVFAVTPNGHILYLDRYRGRIGEDQHWGQAQQLWHRHHYQWLSVEKGFIGTRLIYDAARAGVTIRDYDPRTADKITRALPAVDRYAQHQIWHPNPAHHPWVKTELEPELLGFGGGAAHDDYIDTIAQAVHHTPNTKLRTTPTYHKHDHSLQATLHRLQNQPARHRKHHPDLGRL